MIIHETIQVQVIDFKEEIGETIVQFVKGLNFISRYAREHEIWTKDDLQKNLYYEIRERFGLRSQMVINCIREVVAKYKGKHKKNRKRAFPVSFKSQFYRVNYPRDFSFKKRSIVSINTLHGRVKARYRVGHYQKEMLKLRDGWKMKSSTICKRKDGVVFLNAVIEKELPDHTWLGKDGMVGIDLGMNFVAVTTGSNDKSRFYGGGKVKYKRWLYNKHRKEAQSKGTRSAKRFLRRISKREKRFVTDSNHCISRDIVNHALEDFEHPVIVMEDLTGIRQQRYVGKTHKVNLNKWAFYQLRQFIEYKALETGIPVIYIKPAYTSQDCPKCGHREKSNRNKRLHRFKCKKCGYTSNDDRAASLNIRDRGVVFRYIRETRGFVNSPNVAGDEVETPSGGLTRSLVTSPRL
jgi:IS605 OrfB family transposase